MCEELVKSLRICAVDGPCRTCPRFTQCTEEEGPVLAGVINEAADAIEELSKRLEADAKKPCWIPVTEALPEPYVEVIATDGENVGVASYQVKGNYWLTDGLFDDTHVEVTHWMPLPDPPTEATP